MDELGLSNRGLASLLEPDDDKKRDTLRVRISGWRKGRGMTEGSVERLLPGLSMAAGREIQVSDVLTPGPVEPDADTRLAQLEERVEAVLQIVQDIQRELHGFLPAAGAGGSRGPTAE